MWLKASCIVLVLFFSLSHLFAQEGEGEPATTEITEAVPEDEDWTKQANFLSSKEGKVKEYKAKVKDLIKQKRASTSKAEQSASTKEIAAAHRELMKATEDYNKLYNKLRYRFPGKERKKRRKYLPMRIQSLNQIENEMGLDADLTRIRKKINKKYSPYLEKDLKKQQESGPLFYKGKLKEDQEDQKRIKLEK
ncbi:MAG: hypothetical protein HOO06_12825 [Bdellovibrionaceae bacterium]|nr:hypothetical protein [Pseudobdellovibrionaceae bacterium]